MWGKQSFCNGTEKQEEEAPSLLFGQSNSPGLGGMAPVLLWGRNEGTPQCSGQEMARWI